MVAYEFNRETDSYEAKCPWCEEVVRSHSLEELMKQAQELNLPFDVVLPKMVIEHDCWVEP